ncbi:MAG: hypothetical protein LBP24_01305 [Coriobacteriales bacterium]|jgi:hypothetical protein|nr:hypothetical protein [Coriobacteriales bacterium]
MSGHIRDFSDAAKTELLEQIVLPGEPGSDAWDFLKDLPSIVCPPHTEATDYAKNIDPYHRDIINFKIMSRGMLERIWTNVHGVDERYHTDFVTLTEQSQQAVDAFYRHIDLVNPAPQDGGEPLLLRSGSAFDQNLAAARAARLAWKDAPVSRGVERINDERMQAKIEELLAQDKYADIGYFEWNTMSIDQRSDVLLELAKEVNAVLGTGIDTEQFHFYDDINASGERSLMHYSHSTQQIGINTYTFATSPKDYSLRAIVHEMRHCYQHETSDGVGGHMVSPETRDVWAFNQSNYIDMQADGSVDNLAYKAQPIEYDANRFAGKGVNTKGTSPVYLGSWGKDDTARLAAYLAAPSEQDIINVLLNQGP